ncbi:Phosphotransferase enzyme family [Aspergillus sclerotialis]|uniref:Altered inheritance of mitochondria protein 9, mitochondrial n=1 Tax=Aspergillus sclerotialis TaxID=2070753 RepID=A0A3A3A3B7_9EURO|nr:Phosphotransferase enzyme family [Aspergillus sclerotialis]
MTVYNVNSTNPAGVSWDDEAFHSYTGGRWLYNEEKQRASRSVKFNMDELIRTATTSQGCSITSCVNVEKLPEGDFNKAFLITLSDDREVIAKVPNPNAGLPFYTTASEVATMEFVGLSLSPLLSYGLYAKLSPGEDYCRDSITKKYIIMEKVKGALLSSMWPSMSKSQKIRLIQNVVFLEKSLLLHRFSHIGSIYYESDIFHSDRSNKAFKTAYEGFFIGPTTQRMFFQDGVNTHEYILALARRERKCIQQSQKFPRPEGIFGGPGCYRPTAEKKLGVLDGFEKVASYLLPKDTSVHTPVLWHGDLHQDNIFVDEHDPSKILSIIDWQASHVAPLFQQAQTPGFLDFDGPRPELGLSSLPSLPDNFDSLSADEKRAAEHLQSQQSLYKIYEAQSARENMPVFKALQHSETLGSQIISLTFQVFNDGEPIIRGQLIQLAQEWDKVVGPNGPPCPLKVSASDIAVQKAEEQKWGEGVQMMENVLAALGGAPNGWDGWSSHEDYEALKNKLQIVNAQFLDYMESSKEEREAWERVWPFQDDGPSKS